MNNLKLFVILMLFCVRTSAQKAPVENLVFEGAGIRGLAYSGAVAELEARGLLQQVKRVGGTSAGAITALMLCLDYTAAETEAIIASTSFQKFNSRRFSIAGGIHRMKNYFGWYRGNRFEHWLDALIAAKTGNAAVTFAELKQQGYKDLYITGTAPHMRVRDAVRISMSIPLYFEALFMKADGTIVRHPKKKHGLHVMMDGGLVANFPIKIWDSTRYRDATTPNAFSVNGHTLGFRIDSEAQRKRDSTGAGLAPLPVTTFRQYIIAAYTLTIENLNRQALTA
jgi:NTE family protein